MTTLPTIPPRLIRAIHSGDCVAFIGSGVSCQAGLADWHGLVTRIECRVIQIAAARRAKTQTKRFLRRADNLQIVQYYRNLVTPSEYTSFLLEHFNIANAPSALHKLITTLPFKLFITTNFDALLEAAFYETHHYCPLVCTRYDQFVAAQEQTKPCILKLHGTIQDYRTVIFSQNDYDEFQEKQSALLDYVRTLLETAVILFVGYSFSDPDFAALVGRASVLTGGCKRDDYAVFRKMTSPEIDLMHSRGIHILNVQHYNDILPLFQAIQHQIADGPVGGVTLLREADQEARLSRLAQIRSVFAESMQSLPCLPFKSDCKLGDILVSRYVKSDRNVKAANDCQMNQRTVFYLPEETVPLVESMHKMLLIGEPGSGKSILMRAMAQTLMSISGSNTLVLFAQLRDYDYKCGGLIQHCGTLIGDMRKTSPTFEVMQLEISLAGGPTVLFLDGFDEVDSFVRGHVSRQIRDLQARCPALTIIISSRTCPDYLGLEGYCLLKFIPLNLDEASALLQGTAHSDPAVEGCLPLAQDAIARYPRITANPLLLACLLSSFNQHEGSRLSETRITMGSVRALVQNGYKGLVNHQAIISQEVFLQVIASASFELWLTDHRAGADRSEWITVIGKALAERGDEHAAEDVFEIALQRTGLLRRAVGNVIGFVVRSFHEILVAHEIVRRGLEAKFINEYQRNTAWENVLRFACCLTPPEGREIIMEKLWRANPSLALRTIPDCDDSASILPHVLSVENEDEVIAVLRSIATHLPDSQIVECAEPLFRRNRRNANVLFFAVDILEDIQKAGRDPLASEAAKNILRGFWAEAAHFGILPALVQIPGGIYSIGDDAGTDEDEKPRHEVILSNYSIARSLVTNRDFRAFVPTFEPGYHSAEDNMPATEVTWYEAMLYSRWILGENGRLPTEAEWEVACRGASDGRQYPWGDAPDQTRANAARCIGHATPVGTYPPNDCGLSDMSGNVFEWCLDWHNENYYNTSDLSNPTGPASGRHKAMRGGCWARSWEVARCSYRVRQIPATRDMLVGFRVARSDVNQQPVSNENIL